MENEIKKLTKEIQEMKLLLKRISWNITKDNLSKLPSDFNPMIGKHTTSGEYVDWRDKEPLGVPPTPYIPDTKNRTIDLRGNHRTSTIAGTEIIKQLRDLGWTILTD